MIIGRDTYHKYSKRYTWHKHVNRSYLKNPCYSCNKLFALKQCRNSTIKTNQITILFVKN